MWRDGDEVGWALGGSEMWVGWVRGLGVGWELEKSGGRGRGQWGASGDDQSLDANVV